LVPKAAEVLITGHRDRGAGWGQAKRMSGANFDLAVPALNYQQGPFLRNNVQ
jgi:hypothetical protein